MDMENRPSLIHHYPLKDQQAYSIINVCAFVNTIQKEMEMDIVTWQTESGVSLGDSMSR